MKTHGITEATQSVVSPIGTFSDSLTISGVPVSTGTGASDHGALSGLSDDDHPQYLPVAGGRPMTGTLDITDGIGASPGLRFDLDKDTGVSRLSSDTMGLLAGGTARLTVSGTFGKRGVGINGTLIGNDQAAFPTIHASTSLTISGVAPMTTLAGTSEALDWFIEQPSTGTVTLVQSAAYPFRVDRIIAQTQSNTVKSTLRINGSAITGLSHLTYSTTASTNNATGANQVAIGQKLDATMSGSTGAEGLALSVAIVRV